jgi:dephospho-CoA kinase
MKVLGLTGGIAGGKSAIAAMLRGRGIPVFDADREVHRLLAENVETIAEIAAYFPQAVHDGVVDRAMLGKIVFKDREALRQLEAILHPRVRAAEEAYIASQRSSGETVIALEIPLLFETGAEALCDAVITASAPLAVRHARALAREGMTQEKWLDITARQWTDEARNAAADFVIDTGGTREQTERQVEAALAVLGEGTK